MLSWLRAWTNVRACDNETCLVDKKVWRPPKTLLEKNVVHRHHLEKHRPTAIPRIRIVIVRRTKTTTNTSRRGRKGQAVLSRTRAGGGRAVRPRVGGMLVCRERTAAPNSTSSAMAKGIRRRSLDVCRDLRFFAAICRLAQSMDGGKRTLNRLYH